MTHLETLVSGFWNYTELLDNPFTIKSYPCLKNHCFCPDASAELDGKFHWDETTVCCPLPIV